MNHGEQVRCAKHIVIWVRLAPLRCGRSEVTSAGRASKSLMEMEDGWLLCSAFRCTGRMYRRVVYRVSPVSVSLVQEGASIHLCSP